MDPNTVFLVMAMGAVLGIVLGFFMSGEGYGWIFNAIAGGLGALAGGAWLATTSVDMGPYLNAGVSACAASSLTAMLLRS